MDVLFDYIYVYLIAAPELLEIPASIVVNSE